MVLNYLINKNWKSQIQILGFRSLGTLFVKEQSDLKNKKTEGDIINMLEFGTCICSNIETNLWPYYRTTPYYRLLHILLPYFGSVP